MKNTKIIIYKITKSYHFVFKNMPVVKFVKQKKLRRIRKIYGFVIRFLTIIILNFEK